jgi:thermosome
MPPEPEQVVGEWGMIGDRPVIFLKQGTTRQQGASVHETSIEVGRLLADLLRPTLGPKGMDKMLVKSASDFTVTNDGATILRESKLEHPAAKVLAEAAMSQESEVGDGTKTVVILAGRLLAEMGETLEGIHPMIVERGYRLAATKALDVVSGMTRPAAAVDDALLRKVAQTSLASKVAAAHHELLCDLAWNAATAVAERDASGRIRGIDVSDVEIVKRPGGDVADSTLVRGVVLAKERAHPRMPARVAPARVALVEDAIEPRKTETSARFKITSGAGERAFAEEEEKLLLARARRILDTGANVVLCAKGIAPIVQDAFARAGVYAVQALDEKRFNALARATGGRAAESTDVTRDELGAAQVVEARRMENDELTFVLSDKARSVTILVRGGSPHVMDEVQRTLDDALGTLRDVMLDARVLPGAGAPEAEAALALRRYAASVSGKEQLAVEAYARALESIPRSLAENAGKNAIDVLAELRAAHDAGRTSEGFDARSGEVVDAWSAGIVEPLRVKAEAIHAATEVACMLVRIDDMIVSRRDGATSKQLSRARTPSAGRANR